jgi:hypothetical protein
VEVKEGLKDLTFAACAIGLVGSSRRGGNRHGDTVIASSKHYVQAQDRPAVMLSVLTRAGFHADCAGWTSGPVRQGRGQPGDLVQQPVFGLVGDPMRVDPREARVEARSRGRLDLVARGFDGVGTGYGFVIPSRAS